MTSIVGLAKAISREKVHPANVMRVNALCRSGVVLLCSHIEGYVEELASLAIARIGENNVSKDKMALRFRYFLSQDLLREIKDTKNECSIGKKVIALVQRDLHIWDDSPNFSTALSADAFTRFATPKHKRIDAFFGRFGFDNFQVELGKRLQRNYLACKAMVNNVVSQRNYIAHGDFTVVGAPSDLEDMTRLVKMYCRATDEVVCDWFRDQGWTIR